VKTALIYNKEVQTKKCPLMSGQNLSLGEEIEETQP
jgi:hypothetical protein